MSGVEWHGGSAYTTCVHCGSLVRVNKPVFGSLHICLTDCERRRAHSRILRHRRVGPPWRRRDQYRCMNCDAIVDQP